jgi:hypothetical protein
MVEVLLELHALQLIPLARRLHAEIILHEMTPALACSEVLSYLTARINEDSLFEFVPLCCFIAINLGDNATAEFIVRLLPHQLAVVPRFWLAALIAKSMIDVQLKIWQFVIACPGVQLKDMTDALEIVCTDLGIPIAPFLHGLALLFGKSLLAQPQVPPEQYAQFFQLVHELCFTSTSCRTITVEHEFQVFGRFGKILPAPTTL